MRRILSSRRWAGRTDGRTANASAHAAAQRIRQKRAAASQPREDNTCQPRAGAAAAAAAAAGSRTGDTRRMPGSRTHARTGARAHGHPSAARTVRVRAVAQLERSGGYGVTRSTPHRSAQLSIRLVLMAGSRQAGRQAGV
uniref:Uncharacterized protein n=1 Tax=Oryza sativa subsp. japonica TaxID=39947 RepID=Q5Z6G6_ORYSJ|nr:hypothetical protein [Oryza sativa Japonica Group]